MHRLAPHEPDDDDDDDDDADDDAPRARARKAPRAVTRVTGVRRPAEVVEMVGKRVRVREADGAERVVPVRRRVVVGDRVTLDDEAVLAVEERDTELERAGENGVQTLCANADQVLVVAASTDPPFRPGLVDRLLVAAAAGGMDPILCLNKCDLGMPEEVLAWLAVYEDLGVPVVMVSAAQRKGLDALAERLRGHTTVFVGHSGVGKSSLINTLLPGAARDVGDLDAWGRGRHTTISARLLALPDGRGRIVDVPGIREFGVAHVPRTELRRYFPELATVRCRYRACLHDGEDGCVAEAHISAERLDSYRKLLEETH